jgi:hypothetical protein
MNINYRINKNEMISKFRSYTESTADKKDNYNSAGKDTYNKTKYNILDKIRNIYYFIIENNKLDIRREYIHDDNSFKKVMNKLISRANNKIRINSKGDMHLKAGAENNIIFYGDDNTYREHIYINLKKQAKLIKYIVEEFNEVLANNNPEEEGKAVINSSNYNIFIEYENPVHIINKLLENINKKIILEIFESNFSNFDKYYFEFMKENNIDLDLAKKMIENIHSSFIDSDVPVNMLNKKIQEVDPPKQIYQGISSAGQSIEKNFAQQQPVTEPEKETGLSDKELEYIRKMNESTVSV